jgi:hypothetical protein
LKKQEELQLLARKRPLLAAAAAITRQHVKFLCKQSCRSGNFQQTHATVPTKGKWIQIRSAKKQSQTVSLVSLFIYLACFGENFLSEIEKNMQNL